jgi:branched-chain amino acid transport system permease protein
MDQILLLILLGFGPGALISGLGLGIVLNYRGSGVINIGTGAMALVGAYVFYGLRTGGYIYLSQLKIAGPLATLPALVVTLAVVGAIGALWDYFVLRTLRQASALAKLVASLGFLLTVEALVVLRFGSNGQPAPNVLPSTPVNLFGISVPVSSFLLAGIVLVAAAILAGAYRWTRFGLATRAAAENEGAAVIAGLSPNWISLMNSVLAAMLVGAFGVAVAPLTQLDPVTIPTAVIPALGAALLARFTSFGIAAVAGLVVGAIESVIPYLQTKSWFPTSGGVQLPGVSDLLFFLVIVIVLWWRGAALPLRGALTDARLPAAPAAARRILPAGVLTLACVLALLLFPPDFRQALINSLIAVPIMLSFVVLTGFVGQLSLLQLSLAGVGALATSKLAVDVGIGFPFGPLLAACIATIFGLIAAVSALRVRGVNLAIVTLAGAVALESFVFDNTSWGGGINGSLTPSPHLFGLNLGPNALYSWTDGKIPSPVFGFLCLAVVAACSLAVVSLRKTILGKQMLAVRSNERAAAAAGIKIRNVKLAAAGISSFIVGLGGSLYAYAFGSVSASQFDLTTSITFVAFAYLGGITTVTGALIGGLIVTEGLGFHAIQTWTGLGSNWDLLFGGVTLTLTIATNPEGIAGAVRQARSRLQPRLNVLVRRRSPRAADPSDDEPSA